MFWIALKKRKNKFWAAEIVPHVRLDPFIILSYNMASDGLAAPRHQQPGYTKFSWNIPTAEQEECFHCWTNVFRQTGKKKKIINHQYFTQMHFIEPKLCEVA